jgi:hypothetical protein
MDDEAFSHPQKLNLEIFFVSVSLWQGLRMANVDDSRYVLFSYFFFFTKQYFLITYVDPCSASTYYHNSVPPAK